MKKITLLLSTSLLVLALASCSSKEGEKGLLTLKGKDAYTFDNMYKTVPLGCKLQFLKMNGQTYETMGSDCQKAYKDFDKQVKEKFSISNVKPQDIDNAYEHILKESNTYANSHLSELV